MRVITFSRFFPVTHPRKGEPTFFVEKVVRGLHLINGVKFDVNCEFSVPMYYIVDGKYHTIRAGSRWKVGDYFSPRVWSGKPYTSKQIEFAPAIEIKKIYSFQYATDYDRFWIDGVEIHDHSVLEELASNDGLKFDDFVDWFNVHTKKKEVFEGQILCWNENVFY